MRLFATLFAFTACVGAAACASAPASLAFNTQSTDAMMILVTPTDRSNNLDVFRSVDLQTGAFNGPPVIISVDTFGGLDSLMSTDMNQMNTDNKDRRFALAAKPLPAGTYALVESVRTAGSFGYGWTGIRCRHEVAPVYALRPGQIAVVRVDNDTVTQTGAMTAVYRTNASAPPDQDVVNEVTRIRPKFPKLVGEAQLLKPEAYITWPKTGGMSLFRNCDEPDTFSRLPDAAG